MTSDLNVDQEIQEKFCCDDDDDVDDVDDDREKPGEHLKSFNVD